MQPLTADQPLLDSLKLALGVLELDKNSSLYQDTLSTCNFLEKKTFRIAIFGPFNYGKSTLLNAILGKKTLPIDLIPTTGSAIIVKYGPELKTVITLKDGQVICQTGTEVLKEYAILDDQRRMRDDVATVEVFCPHPFLQTGVELLDLPGTDDQEAQDHLVRQQLLTADLVVQVLDARRLMTLGERENLRDWLLDRGIKTVVFVANFINLLDPEDQRQVYNRLLFVAESFRSDLPPNVSNLYRVDALPALRARLKGDTAAAQAAGLSMFESALQTIVTVQSEKAAINPHRVQVITEKIQQAIQEKLSILEKELTTFDQKLQAKIEIKQKAQKLLQKGFQDSVKEFHDWMSISHLTKTYQTELIEALKIGTFRTWERGAFKQTLLNYQQAIIKWVNQACEFFNQEQPAGLVITFPGDPQVVLPNPPNPSMLSKNMTPIALATGLGWVFGGPVAAAVVGGASYLLGNSLDSDKPQSSGAYQEQVEAAYLEAAQDYLTRFSQQGLSTLQTYEKIAERVISPKIDQPSIVDESRQHHKQLLINLLETLTQQMNDFKKF